MVSGAQTAARAEGNTRSSSRTATTTSGAQAEHLAFMESTRVSGILLASMTTSPRSRSRPSGSTASRRLRQLRAHRRRRVLGDRRQRAGRLRRDDAPHRAGVADASGSSVLVRTCSPSPDDARGCLRAIAEHPGVELVDVDAGDIDPPGGTDAGVRIAAMAPADRPDGVLGVTDLLAMAVVTELRAAGIRVPEDIPVSGCDHNSIAWGGAVPLTSVTQHGEEMGAEAIALLLAELAEGPSHVHRTVVLGSELVARESTLGRARAAAVQAATRPSDPGGRGLTLSSAGAAGGARARGSESRARGTESRGRGPESRGRRPGRAGRDPESRLGGRTSCTAARVVSASPSLARPSPSLVQCDDSRALEPARVPVGLPSLACTDRVSCAPPRASPTQDAPPRPHGPPHDSVTNSTRRLTRFNPRGSIPIETLQPQYPDPHRRGLRNRSTRVPQPRALRGGKECQHAPRADWPPG